MKQSGYFAKICYDEFSRKHIGVNLFSLQLCLHELMLKIMCKKGTKFVSRCWELLLEDFRAIGSFDQSQKPEEFVTKSEYHMHFKIFI